MKEISKKIREARENRGWSQEGLASACKCSLKTISRAENDSAKISQETLKRIATELEIESEIFRNDKKIQLDEITTSYSLINTIVSSRYSRLPNLDEKWRAEACRWYHWRDETPKKVDFELDDFDSDQLPALIEFVTLIENLAEKKDNFELTSELLKTQYEINKAIKNLNSHNIKVFFRLKKDRLVYFRHAGCNENWDEYNKVYELKEKKENQGYEEGFYRYLEKKYEIPDLDCSIGKNHFFDDVKIPIIYMLNEHNPDIKIKNNIKYILATNLDYSYLKIQKEYRYIKDYEYEENEEYFTTEELENLENKYTDKKIQELKAAAAEFDDEFPF